MRDQMLDTFRLARAECFKYYRAKEIFNNSLSYYMKGTGTSMCWGEGMSRSCGVMHKKTSIWSQKCNQMLLVSYVST